MVQCRCSLYAVGYKPSGAATKLGSKLSSSGTRRVERPSRDFGMASPREGTARRGPQLLIPGWRRSAEGGGPLPQMHPVTVSPTKRQDKNAQQVCDKGPHANPARGGYVWTRRVAAEVATLWSCTRYKQRMASLVQKVRSSD